MPETIEWPLHASMRRSCPNLIILGIPTVLVVIALLFARPSVSATIDMLWFDSPGHSRVFRTTRRLARTVSAVFSAATFTILYGAVARHHRTHPAGLPETQIFALGGLPLHLPVARAPRWITPLVSLSLKKPPGDDPHK